MVRAGGTGRAAMPAYQTGLRCFACIPLHSCGFCPIPQKYPSKAFPGEHLESVMETGNSGCCYSASSLLRPGDGGELHAGTSVSVGIPSVSPMNDLSSLPAKFCLGYKRRCVWRCKRRCVWRCIRCEFRNVRRTNETEAGRRSPG